MNDNTGDVGSRWDFMMSVILNKKSLFNKSACHFDHELVTMEQFYNVPLIRETLSKWIESLTERNNRSFETTNNFRTQGNKFYKFVTKNGAEAIECYTRAIFSAPNRSKELGLAHANRAAALIALDYFEEAYEDCKMAKQNAYPKENLLKVLLRQATCSVFLENSKNLSQNIREMENYMRNQGLCEANAVKVNEFKKQLIKLEKQEDNNQINKTNTDLMPKSKHMIEKDSDKFGRFVVADENINKNEAIIEEKAFAFIPVYVKFAENPIDYHCQNCAKTNIIPFPCYECCRASYCCPKCRDEHIVIHKNECAGYKKHIWYEIGIAHLSLRTMLTGFLEAIDEIENITNTTPLKLWNELLLMAENKSEFCYGRVLRLVTNLDKMDRQDMLRYSLTATLLNVYLKNYTLFFEELPQKCFNIMPNKSDWEIFVAALILRHMGQLVCNGHAISDLTATQPSKLNCVLKRDTIRPGMLNCFITSSRIFTAIFPKISIFNHSCDPNIRNKFEKNTLTVYATRNILKNQEIYNCYGPNHKLIDRATRQLALKQQYCFDCKCDKCSQTSDNLDKFQTYICQNPNCKSHIFLKETQKHWWRDDEKLIKIVCSECNEKLNTDWNYHYNNIFDSIQFNNRLTETLHQSYDIYQYAIQIMNEYHEQKLDMAQDILLNFISLAATDIKFELYKKLFKVAADYLKCCAFRFGEMSLEFVVASAYLLDLLAIRKQMAGTFEPEYDLDAIISSTHILSNASKSMFLNYIQMYIL